MSDVELSRLLLSLVLLLSFSLVGGQIFSLLRLPRVIGEICAGLLLGPSILGYLFPDLYTWIFHGFEEQGKLLSVFYWLGLILLMFTAGFKISTTFIKSDRLLILTLILGGMCLPFLFGFLASPLFPNSVSANPLAFSLIMAIASAVTSIPVLTRIFMDIDMLASRFAQAVLAAAAIQDLILWLVLSVAISIQQEQILGLSSISPIVINTIVFAVFSVAIVPTLLRFAGRAVASQSPEGALLGYTLLVCLILVSIASVLRVNIIFGALLAGLVIGRLPVSKLEQVKLNIANIANWFFVPMYFALVGLQINLPANFNAALVIGFLLASSLIKVASVMFLAKFTRISWISALDFGVTMNTRGGPGIVLASVAYAAKIIDEPLFVALVLASILTSLMTGVWLRWRRVAITA